MYDVDSIPHSKQDAYNHISVQLFAYTPTVICAIDNCGAKSHRPKTGELRVVFARQKIESDGGKHGY